MYTLKYYLFLNREKYLLIVFITNLKRFFDYNQRIGKFSFILAVEYSSGNFRTQISRLKSPILKTLLNRITRNNNNIHTINYNKVSGRSLKLRKLKNGKLRRWAIHLSLQPVTCFLAAPVWSQNAIRFPVSIRPRNSCTCRPMLLCKI